MVFNALVTKGCLWVPSNQKFCQGIMVWVEALRFPYLFFWWLWLESVESLDRDEDFNAWHFDEWSLFDFRTNLPGTTAYLSQDWPQTNRYFEPEIVQPNLSPNIKLSQRPQEKGRDPASLCLDQPSWIEICLANIGWHFLVKRGKTSSNHKMTQFKLLWANI